MKESDERSCGSCKSFSCTGKKSPSGFCMKWKHSVKRKSLCACWS